MNQTSRRIVDNVMYDLNGNKQNMYDFLATLPYLPRYYDFNTKNKSFINLHVLLKRLGVKNNKEHLQIFHKELIGIDPHSPALSDNIKLLITQEIRMNPWYYIREVVRIPKANFSQFEIGIDTFTDIFLMMRRQNTLKEAPRQVGKTVGVLTYIGWVVNFAGTGINAANIHYKEIAASRNLSDLEGILNALPDYLQYHNKVKVKNKDGKLALRTKSRSAAKKTKIEVEAFRNEVKTELVGQSKDEAARTARGGTYPIAFIDEFAHIKFNDKAMVSLVPAISEAKRTARKYGKPYGIWMLCTPGDLKTEMGQYAYEKIIKDYFQFGYKHFCMFDMTEEEINAYVKKNSSSSFIFISYTHDKIGMSNDWLIERWRDLSGDVGGMRAEVLLKWEVQTNENPFSPAILKLLDSRATINEKSKVVYKLDDYGNEIMCYPKQGDITNDFPSFLMNYRDGIVIGVDVAYGMGGDADSTVMVGIDSKTLRVIFVYRRNTIDVDSLATLVADLIRNVFIPYNIKVAISPERNAIGHALVVALKKYSEFSKFLVVFPVSQAKLANPDRVYDEEFVYNGEKTKFEIGLNLDSKTRMDLYNLLFKLVAKHTDSICVKPITDEIKTLVKKKTTSGIRIDHAEGEHDDTVVAMLHGMYPIMYNSKLLELRNGINITPQDFILNDGKSTINTTGIHKSRVTRSVRSTNGNIETIYFDKVTNQYISEEQAIEIENKERDSILSGNKEEIVIDNKFDQVVEEIKENLSLGENAVVKKIEDGSLGSYEVNNDHIHYEEIDDYEDIPINNYMFYDPYSNPYE